jgi:hypothetical protein
MIFALLTMLTALSISAVAIYYSVAGLVAIFAAAAIPIIIMGSVLEVGKLVTAVWLHKYWQQATWWLKSYLSVAVIVLMFITSMGIFGFLSKAHIEQTSASQESVAQVERLTTEIARQEGIVARAQERIEDLQSNGVGADANIQAQIDKEQERIDKAFERIQPAIDQQNQIIADARETDATRTKPYEDQLSNLSEELRRLIDQANQYEDRISALVLDTSAVDPLLAQIAQIEESIVKVQGQIASGEREQIRQAQQTIGSNSDGFVGNNTRRAVNAWIEQQRVRITDINSQISSLRKEAQDALANERDRLGMLVSRIRGEQTDAIKDRELEILAQIDNVRGTESPAIQTARDEIQRLRESAESQVAQSQALIERLRAQLAQEDKAAEIDTAIEEQNARIKNANTEIDTLTEEKYALEAEYRKLEAEVGPVKYLAEFVYGETADQDLLEEAVRWVILVIIFVFDPLAVLLLIASQYTFELHRKRKDDQKEGHRLDWAEYERLRAQKINDNPGFDIDNPEPPAEEEKLDETPDRPNDEQSDRTEEDGTGGENRGDSDEENSAADDTREAGRDIADDRTSDSRGSDTEHVVEPTTEEGELDVTEPTTTTDADLGDVVSEDDITDTDVPDTTMEQPEVQTDEDRPEGWTPTRNKFFYKDEHDEVVSKIIKHPEEIKRELEYEEKEKDEQFQASKTAWKEQHPNDTLKRYKNLYVKGLIDSLPWEDTSTSDNYKEQESYSQNAEQSDNTIFNKINKES